MYKFDKETAILEKLQYPYQLKVPGMGGSQDSKSKPQSRSVSQTICTLNFISVIPPKYDCEVVHDESMSRDYSIEENKNEDMMVLGFSKGTFVFVHVKDIETIYARFSIHRQAICKIQQLNSGVFLSICAELTMNLWGFSSKNIVVYKTFRIFRMIKDVSFIDNSLLISFVTSDCELFLWNDSLKELEINHKEKLDDHDGRVTCIDSVLAKGKS